MNNYLAYNAMYPHSLLTKTKKCAWIICLWCNIWKDQFSPYFKHICYSGK